MAATEMNTMHDLATTTNATAWPTSVSRTLEWRCFQRGRCCSATDATRTARLQLTLRGIELHDVRSSRTRELSSSSSTPAAVRIAWRDVLGAAALTPEIAALVPGYTTRSRASPHTRAFVVFGCLPQREALAWDATIISSNSSGVVGAVTGYLGSVLNLLSCFGRGSADDPPAVSDCTAAPLSTAPVDPHDDATTNTKSHGSLRERVLVQWVLECADADAAAFVPRVVDAIRCIADPRTTLSTHLFAAPALPQQPSQRRFLVFVNPAGGSGCAQQLVDSVVGPLLQQSGVACEVVTTQYQHHASDVVATLSLDTYDVIVAVGGDGLLSEIVQGLMKRVDWRSAIQHPLGIVPGGSGNGLAASLLYRSGEAMVPLNAAFALAKGRTHDLDLTSVVNSASGAVMYSFLSLEWAFIADVDIDSERFRMFGSLRFTLSTLAKLLSRGSHYSGTLRYLRSDVDALAPPKYHDVDSGVLAANDQSGSSAPTKLVEARPALAVDQPNNSSSSSSSDRAADSDWQEITGPFHMFWAMSVSHAASDGHIAPGAALDDGYYYIMLMAGAPSRLNLIKLLLGLEDGSHIGKPQVQLIRTRAFTLAVENPRDVLCVDGERFAGPRLEVEVHRALGRVVCLAERR